VEKRLGDTSICNLSMRKRGLGQVKVEWEERDVFGAREYGLVGSGKQDEISLECGCD
jgi:hypothetical protein